MSADSRPSSTDEGSVIEDADDPTSLPTLDPNVLFIDLPDECDDEDSPRRECHVCGGDDSLSDLFFSYKRPSRRSFSDGASRCSSCKAKLLILEAITRDEGINPEAGDILDISGWAPVGFNRSPSKFQVFLPSELPLPHSSGIWGSPRRRTSLNTMEQSILWARNRIKDCYRQHEGCVAQAEGSLTPTRLIDVNPGGMGLDVRLLESTTIPSGTTREYAALSYCWGSYKPACITTPRTKERNLRRISWDLLPRTFRDAVIFTRGLGLKYLWIDSICIIQEDENDWRKEAGEMFDVYKGSKITLGALFGNDSTAGLRNLDTATKQQARHVMTLRIGKDEWPVFIRRHHYLYESKDEDDWLSYADENIRVPLLARAWTYQERILPPRVLLFAENEVIYQCTVTTQCECGSATKAWYNVFNCDKRRIILATQSSPVNRVKGEILLMQETWRWVAKTYSPLNVTNPGDRLVALSAVAEQFQRVRPEADYLAGLWSDSLIEDLLFWRRDNKVGRPPIVDRPFNLPTWSWASVSGVITFSKLEKEAEYLAEVVEAKCIYAKENPFGILESSKLVLRSRILPCSLRDGHVQAGPDDETWKLRCNLDELQAAAHGLESQQVHLLQMARDVFHSQHSIHCLILRLEDHTSKRFSRLGFMFYLPSPRPWDKGGHLELHREFEERGEVIECEII
ncbi:heterokaryon incompatibility protein-domain-containing protein [Phyllosticta capitalensis]